ncbi:AAA family ATPase [Saccharopolyspora mangrovi]|uniref:AAA family ATPase n=1 Tax=Saccharopolyspora mangrovi TaxID=3082379 RepID=A0ABU6AHV3_9PSEU|nr:AAA family ATPase [Saccharopolyspora sp. S2-29]MEB3371154.1 AAA family ATPase [Saccharopolyspora sp. S2-29]
MPGYVLTGAPGAGKTALLRLLEVEGHDVVEEAATDVIALEQALGNDEPWTEEAFIDKVLLLQQQRAARVTSGSAFFDRSPVCTLALSRYLGFAPPRRLLDEVERVASGSTYATTVFLVRNQGFLTPTEARQIDLQESLVFERVHEEVYRELGFDVVDVPAAPLHERASLIERAVAGG